MDLPVDFVNSMREQLGEERSRRLEEGLGAEPSVSVRLNPFKADALSPLSSGAEPVPWCGWGRYLPQRPPFTFDPLLHAGVYYVQEAASMFLASALRPYVGTDPLVALDLCAAPGGKSTLVRSVLPAGSLLVSNEPIRARAQVLAENMTKWGHPGTVVTQDYPDAFTALTAVFDMVIADVPCSGEGMFRKDEGAVADWSLDNVAMCCRRQREILTDVWPALKPGGLLVYSTCTFNRHEDEENIAWIVRTLGAEVLPVPVDPTWQVTGNLLPETASAEDAGDGSGAFPVYRFLPGTTRGEGFFLAVLRKNGSLPLGREAVGGEGAERRKACRKKDRGSRTSAPPFPAACRTWLQAPDDYTFFSDTDGLWRAFPASYAGLFRLLREHCTVLHAGVPVAECKGRDWIPAHGLALSTAFRREAFACCELDYAQAVAYLRKEALVLPSDVPRGVVCLTYRGVPLGFAKQLGNRANNLYPPEWRIRSGHVSPFCLWE